MEEVLSLSSQWRHWKLWPVALCKARMRKVAAQLRDLPLNVSCSSWCSSSGVHPGQRLWGEDHPEVEGAVADLRDHHSVRGAVIRLLFCPNSKGVNRLRQSIRLFASHAPCGRLEAALCFPSFLQLQAGGVFGGGCFWATCSSGAHINLVVLVDFVFGVT